MSDVHTDDFGFPRFKNPVRAKWAPILIAPILDSPEMLVVAGAAWSETGYSVRQVSDLEKLFCLFGEQAEGLAELIAAQISAIDGDFAKRGPRAFLEPALMFEGVTWGAARAAEGPSLELIVERWLDLLASLHTFRNLGETSLVDFSQPDRVFVEPDRLPNLVYSRIIKERLDLASNFNEYIRDGLKAPRKRATHEITIDYKGPRLVANFSTLKSMGLPESVRKVKVRLLDLKVDQERESAESTPRLHELLLQVPSTDDPQVSDRQVERIMEEYRGLEGAADELEMVVKPFSTVSEIVQHIMQKEAA